MRSPILLAALLAVPVLGPAAGCAPVTRERLEEEVLRADPAFAQALEKRREQANRIETFKREYALKRATLERSIAQLRRDLAGANATLRAKTVETKRRLEPDRQRLQLAVARAAEELRSKRIQRATLGRTVARMKKALDNPETGWTSDERASQQAQLAELLADAARLDRELEALHAHLRLLKIKLHLLQL